jgi:uncharacterized protein YjiS (DUF1127 family)
LEGISGVAQPPEAATELCRLTDSELMDIGITRSEIDYVASNRSISPDPLLDV